MEKKDFQNFSRKIRRFGFIYAGGQCQYVEGTGSEVIPKYPPWVHHRHCYVKIAAKKCVILLTGYETVPAEVAFCYVDDKIKEYLSNNKDWWFVWNDLNRMTELFSAPLNVQSLLRLKLPSWETESDHDFGGSKEASK